MNKINVGTRLTAEEEHLRDSRRARRSGLVVGLVTGGLIGSLSIVAGSSLLSGGGSGSGGVVRSDICATEVTPEMIANGVLKCPPEKGKIVTGSWFNVGGGGSSEGENVRIASVSWDGKSWRLEVPGGRFAQVEYPDDWF